jgi:hypothetical protein
VRFCAALLFLSLSALADRTNLKLDNLPRVEEKQSRVVERIEPPEEPGTRFERTIWVMMMRAQRIADSYTRAPHFLPILGTQVVGGSLQLDF